jgi:histidyl-tRNA synthetase
MDFLSPDAREHFDHVLAGLQDLAIPYTLNPRLVRGLDYYCLTAFELTCSHLGAQNAVGAGGRYDTLVEMLGGPPTPAVGFAAGLERISLMLPDGMLPPGIPRVYVAAFGPRGRGEGVKLLDVLRQAGVVAETDFRSTTLKAHLRQADRLGCLYAILLGDDEAATGTVIVRNMITKAQEPVSLKHVPAHLSERLQSSS